MDIVERLRKKKEQYIIHVDYGIGVYEELADSDTPDADCIEAADEIERLREVLGMWLRYSKSDYDDHAQMIIDWSEAKAATKTALKEKE